MNNKPNKPYPTYPLFAHPNGQWAKKIKGKPHYFGVWDDPQAALEKYQRERDSIYGGWKPPKRHDTAHPESTYIIGSDECSRVVIGKTGNWEQRKAAYNKSLVSLKLLAMTPIPEKAIHEKFAHLRVPGYSPEVFRVDDELQSFIDSFASIFRYQECFTGDDTSTLRQPV